MPPSIALTFHGLEPAVASVWQVAVAEGWTAGDDPPASADRYRVAFGDYQLARRRGESAPLAAARLRALATPGEIAEQLQLLEIRLQDLDTTPSLDLDRRLALQLAGAAREAVTRLQAEFSAQPS